MKTNLLGLGFALGLSMTLFFGCDKPKNVQDDSATQQQSEQSEEGFAFQKNSSEPFDAFSTLEFSFLDESGDQQTITFRRNDLVIDLQKAVKDYQKKAVASVDVESCKQLGKALELLYGTNVAQNTSNAVSMLHKLTDVKKPYTPSNWKEYELRCHLIAKYVLSLCYQDGVGASKNLNKALALLKEACFYDMIQWEGAAFPSWEDDLDDIALPEANLEMSVRFLSGNGINPNFAKGLYLLDAAKDRGNAAASGIQMKIMPKLQKLPERFQQKTPSFRMFEGFSIMDITKMSAKERDNSK